MSTSLLYHGFGVRGYRYEKTKYTAQGIELWIEQPLETCRCPECGSAKVKRRGQIVRRFRTVPLGNKLVYLTLPIQRVECEACQAVRQVSVDFAEPRRTYTTAFARYALELSRHMTIKDVALHLGVSWDVIKEIQKHYLQKHFARPKLKHVRRIAIDELSVGSGHRYITVVMDLESGAVLHVGEGKGSAALEPFWRRLRASHAKIEAVATDLSPAYIAAVTENLANATHVFDRFHVIKLYNEKLSALRRDLHREVTDKMHKEVLKGTRWLLLKRPEHLDPARNEPARLEEALRLNKTLATAYYLKELLNEVWEQEEKDEASALLMDWIIQAEGSGIQMLMKFARTLRIHATGILAYYDYPISTGPLEGLNNKITTMKRQTYGLRDQEFQKLKIYAIHQTKYALVG